MVAVQAVEVRLAFTRQALSGLSDSLLQDAVVFVHDSAGRTWLARHDQPGLAVFDALPPGHYTVELDLSGIPQRLEPAGPLPDFRVGAASKVVRHEILIQSRPVRIRQLGGAGLGDGGQGPGPSAPPTPRGNQQ